jgi:hypothetical protein
MIAPDSALGPRMRLPFIEQRVCAPGVRSKPEMAQPVLSCRTRSNECFTGRDRECIKEEATPNSSSSRSAISLTSGLSALLTREDLAAWMATPMGFRAAADHSINCNSRAQIGPPNSLGATDARYHPLGIEREQSHMIVVSQLGMALSKSLSTCPSNSSRVREA